MLMLGDNVFQANLEDVARRQREDRADAAFLIEVPWEDASRYGVCDTNTYGEGLHRNVFWRRSTNSRRS